MHSIAVIGEKKNILEFKAIGFMTCDVNNTEEAKEALQKCVAEEYSIIYLSETFAEGMESELDKYTTKTVPAVILIPGSGDTLGIGLKRIDKSVEKAVGTNIL